MTSKPIFVLTHPRACSTAFERVFMTRRDILQCVHEPFGDAYYYGPERLAERFANNELIRAQSGFGDSTYKTIMDRINKGNKEERRVFIKDMAQYFIPPNNRPTSIAPSLLDQDETHSLQRHVKVRRPSHIETQAPLVEELAVSNGGDTATPYLTPSELHNPTVVPMKLLQQFHFAFLIRHPRSSIPSYYRCTIPPLDEVSGFTYFRPDEAGYKELRQMFDYLRSVGYVGPEIEGRESDTNGEGVQVKTGVKICVIDADDMLDHPSEILKIFCDNVGIDFSEKMLDWSDEGREVEWEFEKWKGFHEDVIHSKDLKPRQHKKAIKSDEEQYEEWKTKFGEEGANLIQKTVAENIPDYEYLRQFCVKI